MGRLMKKTALVLFLPLLSGGLMADQDHRIARDLLATGKIFPLEVILERLQPAFPGAKILELELEQEGGRVLYEVELLDSQGQVWEVDLDATSGELLERERED